VSAKILDPRVTEQRNPRTAEIDLASPLEIVDLMNAEDRTVAHAVATQRERIAEAVSAAEETFRRGGRLFYAGAGTSGRLGVLDASECPPRRNVASASATASAIRSRWVATASATVRSSAFMRSTISSGDARSMAAVRGLRCSVTRGSRTFTRWGGRGG